MEIDVPNSLSRRHLLSATAAIGAAVLGRTAHAQGQYPTGPVTLVTPYSPGGGADTSSRLFAAPMADFLSQPIIVENRPGAGGTVGATRVARAQNDGYTLLWDAQGHTVAPYSVKNVGIDYRRSFAPITQVLVLPQVLVVPVGSPHRTLEHLFAAIRAKPGEVAYGTSGKASAAHLAGEMMLRFKSLEGYCRALPWRRGRLAGPQSWQDSLRFRHSGIECPASCGWHCEGSRQEPRDRARCRRA
ncbi:Bug family tripartite tricarboxylate transporter substrate binding protein [Muricoccus vinaceus]|uniref:Bug family tripartite tricarboxylate transporter substrate binding protein n=1 Tax=Muricoccus vinaceus TaxID=424704 RepID=A0ABV6J4A2_9PROT